MPWCTMLVKVVMCVLSCPPLAVPALVKVAQSFPASAPLCQSCPVPSKKAFIWAAAEPNRVGMPKTNPWQQTYDGCWKDSA